MFNVPFLRKSLGKTSRAFLSFGLLESFDLGPVHLHGFLAAPETALGTDAVKSL